jgi:hypothetical protein
VSSQEVSVEMGQKDMADLKILTFSICQILVDIALGIDNHSGSALLIRYQIGGVRETTQVVLFEDQLSFLSSTAGGQNDRFEVWT